MKNLRNLFYTLICALLLFHSCTSNKDFRKGELILTNQGYTNITNEGYSFLCCSNEDDFSTGFTAKDVNGNIVSGCFCSSVGKGMTIRFN